LRKAKTISAHPLINTMTTTIAVEDMLRLFAQTGHEPRWCALPVKSQA
jgi:Ala-tRNA(Pro) deacylase